METMPRILIVDDDRELSELLVEVLPKYGYAPQSAQNGREMYQALERDNFDLLILDIMMPGDDGLTLCRALRSDYSYAHIPIIFLTALDDFTDVIVGLEIGGDDYIPKPFQTRELVARMRAVLRRAQLNGDHAASDGGAQAPGATEGLIEFDKWQLNVLARHLIDDKSVVVPLSAAEFRLLSLFLEHPHEVVTRDQILDYLASRNLNIYDRSIDAQISRLRQKLRDKGPNPSLIKTMRGDGYMLACSVHKVVKK